jgi:hypothetical protein
MMDPATHNLNVLAALVENRLDATERTRVVAHLAACEDCRATLSAYIKVAGPVAPRHTTAASEQRPKRAVPVWLPIAATLLLTVAAAVISLQLRPNAPAPQPGVPTPSTIPQPVAPTPADPPAVPPARPPAAEVPQRGGSDTPESPLRLRSGQRKVGDKTFRLIAGEWVDRAYDPLGGLPVVEATTPQSRAALIERVPALKPFFLLGDRVTVVHDGTVYRFVSPQ